MGDLGPFHFRWSKLSVNVTVLVDEKDNEVIMSDRFLKEIMDFCEMQG